MSINNVELWAMFGWDLEVGKNLFQIYANFLKLIVNDDTLSHVSNNLFPFPMVLDVNVEWRMVPTPSLTNPPLHPASSNQNPSHL